MINRFIGVGRLTKDPEFRTTPNGVSVTTFTIAVNRTFTNAQGEREADFINCVTFRKQADNVNKFLTKGHLQALKVAFKRVVTKTMKVDAFLSLRLCVIAFSF